MGTAGRGLATLTLAAAISGCVTTSVRVTPLVTSVSASTLTGDLVPGEWVLVFDDNVEDAHRRELRTETLMCSGFTLELNSVQAIRSAFEVLARQLFESVHLAARLPTGPVNALHIGLREFRPQMSVTSDRRATASVELTIDVTLLEKGRRRALSVHTERREDRSGAGCDGVFDLADEQVRKAARDVAERAGERLANMLGK